MTKNTTKHFPESSSKWPTVSVRKRRTDKENESNLCYSNQKEFDESIYDFGQSIDGFGSEIIPKMKRKMKNVANKTPEMPQKWPKLNIRKRKTDDLKETHRLWPVDELEPKCKIAKHSNDIEHKMFTFKSSPSNEISSNQFMDSGHNSSDSIEVS